MNKNISLLFLFFSLIISCQSEKILHAQVGDIQFDAKLDDPGFKKCSEYAQQYYTEGQGYQYEGEKYLIEEDLDKFYKIPQNTNGENGYITVRFLVNCEGKTGLFRVSQMSDNYAEKLFPKEIISQLLNFTKNLNGWQNMKFKNKKFDYYQYLTYKIEDGKVLEILP